MVVDNLKSCYRTMMRIRVEPELIVPVRWYFAPATARLLPAENAFMSSVWEDTDREYPQSGLGEVDLQRTWDNGKAPPGVTGLNTPTPLAWFAAGLPRDFVYPPPNAAAPVLIDLRQEVGCVDGPFANLTDEGAVSMLSEELPQIRRWEFLLFVWPAVVNDETTFADLVEASFPGYARRSPDWTDAALTAPSQATTFAAPLSWTRAAGGASSQTVFGWAAVGAGAPARLRSLQLLPSPATVAIAGDNVTLCPIQLLLGLCQLPHQLQATGGDEDGGTAFTSTGHVLLATGGDEDGNVTEPEFVGTETGDYLGTEDGKVLAKG